MLKSVRKYFSFLVVLLALVSTSVVGYMVGGVFWAAAVPVAGLAYAFVLGMMRQNAARERAWSKVRT